MYTLVRRFIKTGVAFLFIGLGLGLWMLVRRELLQTTGREVTIGSVYGTLDRLEEKGLISSWRGDPDAVRGGRSRRYFKVEPAGEAALALARDTFRKMWDGVEVAARQESGK